MNIAKLLKDAPKGTKLYSPLLGECELVEILDELKYPIKILTSDNDETSFTKDGKFFSNEYYNDTECLLFPSKENRDWNTFKVIKPGDIIVVEEYIWLMKDRNTAIFSYDTICGIAGYGSKNCVINNYEFANTKQKEKLFEELEKKGFKYDPINVSIEPIEKEINVSIEPIEKENETSCEFKPFDKVLVRNEDNEPWSIQFFGYYDMIAKDEAPYVCLGNSMCIADTFKQCIPFKGNEKLLGHYNSV